MDIKRTLKNNVAGANYLIPFLKRYKFGEASALSIAKNALINKFKIKGYYPSSGLIGNAWLKLFSNVKISINDNSPFVYFIDENKTLALKGNTLGNFSLDYSQILEKPFIEIAKESQGNDNYGKEAALICKSLNLFVERILEEIKASDLSSHQKSKQVDYFQNMLVKKSKHFDESLQRILFFNQIL